VRHNIQDAKEKRAKQKAKQLESEQEPQSRRQSWMGESSPPNPAAPAVTLSIVKTPRRGSFAEDPTEGLVLQAHRGVSSPSHSFVPDEDGANDRISMEMGM
jgi:hypothetical protein